nr:FCD domain-containing protein [Kibdelosporangium phytohabitans]
MAAEPATDEDLAAMVSALDRMADAADDPVEADLEFHRPCSAPPTTSC